MSADDQGDSVILNTVESSSANNDTATNKTISQALAGSSSLPKVDSKQISSAAIISSASNLELHTVDDIETKQTHKPTETEKALDVDSELDFELKWDDDNELNPGGESKMDTDPVPNDETEKMSNEVANEQETIGEPCNTAKQVENATNEQVADKDYDEGDLLNTAVEERLLDSVNTQNENEVFKVDTNSKIDLGSKVSPVDSETNSLDEHLVYSDVEAPEIEEKDLLDELDAHISPNNSNDEKLEIKIETPEVLPGENSKKSSSQQFLDSTAMDVDDLILLPVKKEEIPDVNDTLSSNTEMETSTYEVNKEHGLAKPDVMIEIPTQEYIEDFDDSGELSEEGEQYDEDILLNNDSSDIQKLVGDNRKATSPIRDEDRISVKKPVFDKSENSSDKTKDKNTNVATEESHADVILEATHSEPKLTTVVEECTADSKLTTVVEEHTADSISTTDDEVQPIAEPKLMTNDEEPTADSKSTTDDDAQPTTPKLPTNNDEKLTAEPDDVEPIDEPKLTTNDKVQPTDEPKLTTNVKEPTADPKSTTDDDVQPTAVPKSTTNYDVLPTAVTEVKEISSPKTIEATKEVDNHPVESGPNTIKAKDVSHSADLGASLPILELPKVSEAHDSSSTDWEKTRVTEDKDDSSSDNLETKELPDGDNVSSSEVIKPTEVAEAEIPCSTAEPKEASGKTDSAIEAQSSTSKYSLQELSDEDQEVTDSLGLLAESSRVMDDDDEQEQEHEDEDDDDDFDQDDESNQMTAEHSEDSNAQQSETDAPRESMEVEESPTTDKEEFQFPADVEDTTGAAEAQGGTVVTAQAEKSMDDDVMETEKAVQALLGAETAEEPANDASLDDASDGKQAEEIECVETEGASKLRQLLLKDKEHDTELPEEKKSPSKVKKLEISKTNKEINIVDLGGSSSEDDIQEVKNRPSPSPEACGVAASAAGGAGGGAAGGGAAGGASPPHKTARLNTSEVSISTASVATEPIPLPDASTSAQDSPAAPKFGLEVFSLDSDDDEKQADQTPKKMTAIELDRVRQNKQCVNMYCTSDSTTPLLPCDARCAAYYGARRGAVCQVCAFAVAERTQGLIEGVRQFAPLLSLDMGQTREELVEISDSDSEDDADIASEAQSVLGDLGAKFLEENLADMFNATWTKFKLDERLLAAQDELDVLVNKMEGECTEIDTMLSECQQATDKLRRDLYDSFAHERQELPAILIYDTPPNTWSGLEDGILAYENSKETRQSKRRMAAATEPPAKRPAIPLGYAPLDSDANTAQNQPKPTSSPTEVPVQADDDGGEVSVVRLAAEAAPAGLPRAGAARRAALRAGAPVYAMRNAYGTWHKAKIIDVQPKGNNQFTMCKVKFEHKVKNPCKLLPARCLAYDQPSDVRMTIGTRVIALFKDPNNSKAESYYSGIVAEIPNPVNNYRYLVFFDDGYAQYVSHDATRLVCECAKLVWDEVHPFSRQFVRDYLRAFPERPMVRAHAGQSLKTEWNGKWWVSRVVKVDASLVQVHFEEDDRYEWIYRGSTRLAPLYLELQAAERQRARPLPRAQPGRRFNMPYVEYTRSEESAAVPATAPTTPQQIEQEIRRQRAVAKKSTALPPAPAAPAPTPLDGVTSRVVFYTPKNAIRPLKMRPHTCGPQCKRTDVLALKDLRTYNPLTKPLLSGWERQIVKFRWTRSVMYRTPCGRRIRDYRELHHYLQLVDSEMGVDLFDFGVNTHCLAEFVLNKCFISKKDLSNGRESVPVPCVNYYDESLPEFCSYNTKRTPTVGVPLNLDPEFLCGCDCTDDCADKSKCACWKLTLEGARTIGFDSDEVGYAYKRLPEPLPSGIYECNSRCKCKQTCLNRVAQHPLQLKLQVFKTLNRGWGIRALNDVPRGAFLCVYAGNLLTDATANLDGLNEGDEYLAELDYIEVVEQMKEGFEEDIPDEDKRRDKKESGSTSPSESEEEEEERQHDNDDDDFRPAEHLLRAAVPAYSKRLRKREKKKKEGEEKEKEKKEKERSDDNCITISDDEELREPARFSAQTGPGAAGFVSKYKSVRAHFGKDEACYIMDAKVQGNIGRYLNHSCTPNVFVQNVFVDTHDPRFPWVAFFALAHIRAGTELTWNYNYDVGSVPGKVLYCHCAAPNCRGRLL